MAFLSNELAAVWGQVNKWMHNNGYRPAAAGRAVYLNDWDKTPPEELLIEVQVPVALKDQA